MVFQLLEIDNVTGCLTRDENRVLFKEPSHISLHQNKLKLLVRMLRYVRLVGKQILQTMALSPFCTERNLSQL